MERNKNLRQISRPSAKHFVTTLASPDHGKINEKKPATGIFHVKVVVGGSVPAEGKKRKKSCPDQVFMKLLVL